MNIKSMLVRLQNALDRTDLVDQLLLLPGYSASLCPTAEPATINLLVGYNSSPDSHAALDLTLWIAHQTRLVTHKPVMVQVVYVLNQGIGRPSRSQSTPSVHPWGVRPRFGSTADLFQQDRMVEPGRHEPQFSYQSQPVPVCTLPQPVRELDDHFLPDREGLDDRLEPGGYIDDWFKQADHVLWQARCLANEWRGSLKTHLRFGDTAQELTRVAVKEAATLLIVGCTSADHPLLNQLGERFPCPVLGIPRPGFG